MKLMDKLPIVQLQNHQLRTYNNHDESAKCCMFSPHSNAAVFFHPLPKLLVTGDNWCCGAMPVCLPRPSSAITGAV